MNVLSVFDGMSCGQIALERAGIKVDNYFASEIDKYAIQITQKNYPNTIQLGDINNWKIWKLPKIDMLIGGSPCQGFSFAGRGLNFDDPRSKLFFVYVKILKRLKKKNPDLIFLLENVRMKKEHQAVISKYLGVEPIMIDSALVSAQSRKRLYWTNIKGIEQPDDRGIYLRDIIQKDSEIDDAYLYSLSHAGYVKSPDQKAGCLTGGAHSGGNHSDMTLLLFPILDGTSFRKLTPLEWERLQTVPDRYTSSVSNTQRYKMIGNGWTVDVITHIFGYIDASLLKSQSSV